MSAKAQIMKEFAEYHLNALEETLKGLDEKEANYKPTGESNTVEWVVNHLCRITNTALPRIIKGDPNYKPIGWPDDYKEQHYSLDKYMADLAAGKRAVLDGIGKLTDAELEQDISLWGGTRKRKVGLFAYIGEIVHHKGQIAYIRGTVKRFKAKDSNFLDNC
ncbi:MAG: DinB family protein [Candidatus Bathyarchaeota archaeon]|nr:DinB family protein [Candidatus Bathyarchaeota archaeon]